MTEAERVKIQFSIVKNLPIVGGLKKKENIEKWFWYGIVGEIEKKIEWFGEFFLKVLKKSINK